MRSKRVVQLLLTLVLIVLVSSLLFFTDKPADTEGIVQAEVLSMYDVEDVRVLKNGNAEVSLSIEVDNTELADMYRNILAAPGDAVLGEVMPIPENRTQNGMVLPVRQEFHSSIKKEQKTSLGFAMKILDSNMTPLDEEGGLKVLIDGYMTPQVSVTPTGSDGVWEILIGPKDEAALAVAAGDLLTKISFAQQLLGSIDGDQVYDASKTIRCILPEEAKLLNSAELEDLSWTVDFGGDTFICASISLDGSQNIVLSERTYVTEKNNTATPTEIFNAFRDYKTFTVRYFLPGCSVISGENIWVSNDGDWAKSWDFYWAPTFNIPIKREYAGVKIDATLRVTPAFSLSGYMGFDFSWHKHKADWWPHPVYYFYEPDWFEAWIGASASLDVQFFGKVTADRDNTYEKPIFENTLLELEFSIGGVPVWADLDLSLIASLHVRVDAELDFSMGTHIETSFKGGFSWKHGKGWSPITSATADADFTGPEWNLEGYAEIEPSLILRLSFLLYGQAGPYIDGQLYINGRIQGEFDSEDGGFADSELRMGFRINVGLWMKGRAADLLGISYPYKKTLYDKTLWDYWIRIGKAPSKISITPEPASTYSGGAVLLSGAVTSDYRGNKRGDVLLEYKPEGSEVWQAISEVESTDDGRYSLWWVVPLELLDGNYQVRASWEGNNGFREASTEITVNVSSYKTGLQWLQNHDGSSEDTVFANSYPRGVAVKFSPPRNPWFVNRIRIEGGYLLDGDLTVEVWEDEEGDINQLSHNEFKYSDYFGDLEEDLNNYGWSKDINLPNVGVTGDFYIVLSCNGGILLMGVNTEGTIWPDYEADLQARSINWTYDGQERLVSVGGFPLSALWVDHYDIGKYNSPLSQTFIPTNEFYLNDYGIALPTQFTLTGSHKIDYELWYLDQAVYVPGPGIITAADWNGTWNLVLPISGMYDEFKHNIGDPWYIRVYLDDNLMIDQAFRFLKREISVSLSVPETQTTVGESTDVAADLQGLTLAEAQKATVSFMTTTDNITLVEDPNWTILYASTPEQNPDIFVNPAVGPWDAYGNLNFQEAGLHWVKAVWMGSDLYAYSESETVTIQVNPADSALEIQLLSNPMVYGSGVNMTAQVFPSVNGTEVTFQYSYDQKDWFDLGVGVTDAAGLCYGPVNWNPPDIGYVPTQYNLRLRASWLGNAAHDGCKSPITTLIVLPPNLTQVEIVSGANAELDQAPEATTNFGVRVKDLATGEYIKSTGKVEFFVTDYFNKTSIFIGGDNDTDGDGIYQFDWTIIPQNWTNLGPQYWGAEFTGPNYSSSTANSNLTIYYHGAALWIEPRYQEFDVTSGALYNLKFSWKYFDEAHTAFSLSTDLSPEYITLSKDYVLSSDYFAGTAVDVYLTLLPAYPIYSWLGEWKFTVTATDANDANFNFSATANVFNDFTPNPPTSPTGGLAVSIKPKTVEVSNNNSRYLFITVCNNQNFDDKVTVEISSFGTPEEYQAQQEWFSQSQFQIYVPAGSGHDSSILGYGVILQLPEPPLIQNDLDMYFYTVTVTSTTTSATAKDYGIIKSLF
jgi:hypothetical protein